MEEITRLQPEYFVQPRKKILAYENTNAGGISDNCRAEFKYTFFVNFFFHSSQIGSGVHPASQSNGTRETFRGGKAVGQ